jgi:glutamine synthetase
MSDGRLADTFGCNSFNDKEMEKRLPRAAFERMRSIVRGEDKLDADLAATVAHGVKEWALERGVSHYTHWFQPMTESTAEKHDAFLDFDSNNRPIERLSGGQLIQSEPDASSFPSGGLRQTFEARGYAGWDPTSNMFLIFGAGGGTLCIPSVFVDYTGSALDMKTPLLRSGQALSKQACDLLTAVGRPTDRVVAMLGAEQEYFLIDRALHALRPDLALCGRTMIGSQPPKGQALDDHYFGTVPARVLSYMQDVEHELYKLSVPAKTRHNEVAPSQFELAAIYREASLAVDHNQLVMETLKKVAVRHDFHALLHEKPYAKLNGSGKHCNWSMSTAEGENLLDPGDTPERNLRFLAVLASVLLGVHHHAALLRASIAGHSNDFRLGAAEAPPAIISVFLGDRLSQVHKTLSSEEVPTDAQKQKPLLRKVSKTMARRDTEPEPGPLKKILTMGVSQLPGLVQDDTDRNRTSPFAFTGNKFEFRAVGSSQSPAKAVTILNTVVAEGMRMMLEKIAAKGGGEASVLLAIKEAFVEAAPVIFEGDGYSTDWVTEAESRGLPNLFKTPEALEQLRTEKSRTVLGRHGVFSESELESRYNVYIEQYITLVQIELDMLLRMVDTMIMPLVIAERGELALNLKALHDLNEKMTIDTTAEVSRFEIFSRLTAELHNSRKNLEATRTTAMARETQAGVAHSLAHDVLPSADKLREVIDQLEDVVTNARWPLPKYHEMLFMNSCS